MSRTRAERPKRVPMSQRNILAVRDLEEGYHYRWFTDKPGRIQAALEAGYEFVEGSTAGDVRVADATPVGAKTTKQVGGGDMGYLMRLPADLRQEDEALKAKRNDETEVGVRREREKVDGAYGEGLTNR